MRCNSFRPFGVKTLAIVENRNAQHAIQVASLRTLRDRIKNILWRSRGGNIKCNFVLPVQMLVHGKDNILQNFDNHSPNISTASVGLKLPVRKEIKVAGDEIDI